MAIGPVQLLVLGFPQPDFRGEIIDELERLRQSDTVRVIDALAVWVARPVWVARRTARRTARRVSRRRG